MCRTEAIGLTYPGVDLALITVHHCGDMVLHDIDQSGFVSDRRDPRWELGVPHLASLASLIVVYLSWGFKHLPRVWPRTNFPLEWAKLTYSLLEPRKGAKRPNTYQIVRSRERELPTVCYFLNQLTTPVALYMLILTLSSIPLHTVLRSQLTEIGLNDCRGLCVFVQGVLITNISQIFLPVSL